MIFAGGALAGGALIGGALVGGALIGGALIGGALADRRKSQRGSSTRLPWRPVAGAVAFLLLGWELAEAQEPAHAPRVGARVRLDGVAALVGGSSPGPNVAVVLHSDVSLRARLHLLGEMQGVLPLGSLPPTLLEATLDEIIGEVLIAREANRLRIAPPSERNVAAQKRRLIANSGGETRVKELLAAVGATEQELTAIADRRAKVDAFLRANLEGTTVVTAGEVERAFQSGDHPYVGRELDDIREPLRAWLSRQALDRAVRRWVQVLRRRAVIRIHDRGVSDG